MTVQASIWSRDRYALSIAIPVDLRLHVGELPAFVQDLIPQGEPLKRLLSRYKLQNDKDYKAILSTVPLAPPGNIRVKNLGMKLKHAGLLICHLVLHAQIL